MIFSLSAAAAIRQQLPEEPQCDGYLFAHLTGGDERKLLHPANWNCRAVEDFRVPNIVAEKQSLMCGRSLKGKCVPTVVMLLSSQFSIQPLICDTGI